MGLQDTQFDVGELVVLKRPDGSVKVIFFVKKKMFYCFISTNTDAEDVCVLRDCARDQRTLNLLALLVQECEYSRKRRLCSSGLYTRPMYDLEYIW